MGLQSQIWILDQFSIFLTIAEYGILGDLLAFLIQSESPADFLQNLVKWRMPTCWQLVLNPQNFWRDPAEIRIWIWINLTIRIGSPQHFWLQLWRWQRFALSEHSLVVSTCRWQICQSLADSWVSSNIWLVWCCRSLVTRILPLLTLLISLVIIVTTQLHCQRQRPPRQVHVLTTLPQLDHLRWRVSTRRLLHHMSLSVRSSVVSTSISSSSRCSYHFSFCLVFVVRNSPIWRRVLLFHFSSTSLPCDAMPSCGVCLSVCLSFVDSVETSKHFSPSGIHRILVFQYQNIRAKFRLGASNGGVECRWGS